MGHRPLNREADADLQIDDVRRRVERLERRFDGGGRFVGIVFPSAEPVVVGDDAGGWFLAIPEDLNGTKLIVAHAVVYTPGTGTECQVRNVTAAVDMLATAITIDSGDQSSFTAATQPVIETNGDETVSTADIVVVDVDDADAVGLDIILAFA